MGRHILLITLLAAAAAASAGPLDNYRPTETPPQAPGETAKKWLAGRRTTFNNTLTTRNYTFNETGCPVGYRQMISNNGTLQSQTEEQVLTWDTLGRCTSRSYDTTQLQEYGYDEYGRVTSYKLTTYQSTDGSKEISNVRTAEYAYDETGNTTLNASKVERFLPRYSVYGSKWERTTETSADGVPVTTTVNYSWDAETGGWVPTDKSTSTTATDGDVRTGTMYGYRWNAATSAWVSAGKTVTRYQSGLIPGVDMTLMVGSTTYELDAEGAEVAVTQSHTVTFTPNTLKNGEYEYSVHFSVFSLDAEGKRVESYSEDTVNNYETYTDDEGTPRVFMNFISLVRKNRDNESGQMFVTYKSVENFCRYGTLNRETISYQGGDISFKARFESVYDELGRQTESHSYNAMGEEEYIEGNRTLTAYLDDTRAVASRKVWRRYTTSAGDGDLELSEDVAYEYDTSVAGDEVVALPGQIAASDNVFMLTKSVSSYQGSPREVVEYTYFDRSEMVGVENVAADREEGDASLPAEIYTLGGVKVGEFASPRDAGLPSGLYIERRGSSARKVRL